MKTVGLEQTSLDTCVRAAQREGVIITRQGKPVALIIGIEGLDREQVELGASAEFWELVAKRRTQRSVSREELEREGNLPE